MNAEGAKIDESAVTGVLPNDERVNGDAEKSDTEVVPEIGVDNGKGESPATMVSYISASDSQTFLEVEVDDGEDGPSTATVSITSAPFVFRRELPVGTVFVVAALRVTGFLAALRANSPAGVRFEDFLGFGILFTLHKA